MHYHSGVGVDKIPAIAGRADKGITFTKVIYRIQCVCGWKEKGYTEQSVLSRFALHKRKGS